MLHLRPSRPRVLAALALVLVALTAGLAAGSPATASTPGGVKVLDGDTNVLVVFRSAKCSVSTARRAIVHFYATAKHQGWTMHVIFYKRLTGFHTYDVPFGRDADVSVSVTSPSGSDYSTLVAPPQYPPAAGAVRLGPRGARMAVGIYAAFTRDLQDGVALAGALKCNYPRKRR
jgi:hypothetical protein